MHAIGVLSCIILCLATTTLAAADPVTMRITSAGSNVMAGVYVNPYSGTINGSPAALICDDYFDHTPINYPTWTAQGYTLGEIVASDSTVVTRNMVHYGLTGEANREDRNTRYEAAAYLAVRLMGESSATQRGSISYALWGLFDSSAIAHLTNYYGAGSAYVTAANAYRTEALNAAAGNTYASWYLTGVRFYTPTQPLYAGSNVWAQEFVHVPESSAWSVLVFNLSVVLAAVWLFRKRVNGTSR